ncbi:MAG: acetyl-CoA carboxylase biotin carboxyl carrier protein subunit [Candidatus Limnocylindrales bacterium]
MSDDGAAQRRPAGPSRGAIRASIAQAQGAGGDTSIVVAPSVAPEPAASAPVGCLVDGTPVAVVLRRVDERHAVLELEQAGPDGSDPTGSAGGRHRLLLGPAQPLAGGGIVRREILVDGWRVEVEIEAAWRFELRERARRSAVGGATSGPREVRASIPGRIVAVSVAAGDEVQGDDALVVLEAMKMQNEIRAVRHGFVERVAVGVGENVEVGDLLLVIR